MLWHDCLWNLNLIIHPLVSFNDMSNLQNILNGVLIIIGYISFERLWDCQQLTFILLSRFCLLIN